jgi:hypothetical protein
VPSSRTLWTLAMKRARAASSNAAALPARALAEDGGVAATASPSARLDRTARVPTAVLSMILGFIDVYTHPGRRTKCVFTVAKHWNRARTGAPVALAWDCKAPWSRLADAVAAFPNASSLEIRGDPHPSPAEADHPPWPVIEAGLRRLRSVRLAAIHCAVCLSSLIQLVRGTASIVRVRVSERLAGVDGAAFHALEVALRGRTGASLCGLRRRRCPGCGDNERFATDCAALSWCTTADYCISCAPLAVCTGCRRQMHRYHAKSAAYGVRDCGIRTAAPCSLRACRECGGACGDCGEWLCASCNDDSWRL